AATVPASEPTLSKEEIQKIQAENQKKFAEFKDTLFRLATRLEKSERQEMKEQAKVIRKALDEVEKKGVDSQFAALVTGLSAGKTAPDFSKLSDSDKQLVETLKGIMTMLDSQDDMSKLKE